MERLKTFEPRGLELLGVGGYAEVYGFDKYAAKVPRYEEDYGPEDLTEEFILWLREYNRRASAKMIEDGNREYAIGLRLNEVPTPNFVKTCGLMKWEPSELGRTLGKETLPVILQERVDGENLRTWLKGHDYNLTSFSQIWLQIVYSMQLAQEHLGVFVHNDLGHGSNILIQTLPEEIEIFYSLHDGTRYVKTRYLVKIFDYGLCILEDMSSQVGLGFWKGFFDHFPSRSYTYLFDLVAILTSRLLWKNQDPPPWCPELPPLYNFRRLEQAQIEAVGAYLDQGEMSYVLALEQMLQRGL